MSIDDDIKALREKHPYLNNFTDMEIAREGFLKVPDSAMQEYANIKTAYLQISEDTRRAMETSQQIKATLEPTYYADTPKPEPVPEVVTPQVEEPETTTYLDRNLNTTYEAPETYSADYTNIVASSLDILQRAERGDYEGLTPELVESAINIVFKPSPNDDRSHTLMTQEEAEESTATKLFRSVIPYIEPFDYPRGLSWSALGYASQFLPDTDTWIGQQLQDAAGIAGSIGAESLKASVGSMPLLLGATNLTEDVGFGDMVGRNLYDAASSGQLANAITEFHGDGIPFVDLGYKLPNLTGPNIMNIVLPKDEVAKLRDKAKSSGASDVQIEALDKLATSDTFRTIAGLVPEMFIDPLWLAGPAKLGSVINKGGKAILIGPDLGAAAKAISGFTNQKVDDVLKMGVDAIEGSDGVLDDFSAAATELSNRSVAMNEAADALSVASKSQETAKKAALQELTTATEKLTQQAADMKLVLQSKNASVEIANIDRNLVQQLDALKRIAATIESTDDGAKLYLKTKAKSLRYASAKYGTDAESINKFVTIVQNGGTAAQRQAQLNKGFSFHVPLTSKQWTVNPTSMYSSGLKLTPKPGDTAQSIAGYVGLNLIDLARLNNFDNVADLERAIEGGSEIIYQLGYLPSSIKKNLGLSLLPEGVVAAYLKGAVPTSVVQVLGDFRRYISTSNAARVAELKSLTRPITMRDELALYLNKIIGQKVNRSVDAFYQLFASRFTQPLMASQSLARAMRFFENRSLTAVRALMTPNETALIRLQTVAPDLWNAYQDSVTSYLRAVSADNQRISAFMNGINRQANEIALARTAATGGKEVTGVEIMEEVMHAIESGQNAGLNSAETALKNALVTEIQKVSDAHPVEREAVKQSLMAMNRFITSDPLTLANQLEEVKRLELLLEETFQRGLTVTKEKTEELRSLRDTLASIKVRGATSEAKQFKNDLLASLKNALVELRQARKSLKERKIVDGKLVDVTNPMVKQTIDDVQDRVVALSEELSKRSENLAATKGVVDGKVMLTAPRFTVPVGRSTAAYTRPLLRWEINLFSQFKSLVDDLNTSRIDDGLEAMTKEEVFRGVMAIFQDSPDALKTPEAFREVSARLVGDQGYRAVQAKPLTGEKSSQFVDLDKQIDQILKKSPGERTADDTTNLASLRAQQDRLYFDQWTQQGGFVPQAIGRRFGTLPEDIKEITEAMSQMFQKYEALYKKYGRDFTKDPFERMQLWGVVGYVPHLRKDFKNPIDDKAFTDLYSAGGLDRQLSLNLDQSKQRKINGLIAEINALPKGNNIDNWSFSADPQLLIANFMSGSKSLNNQDFLVTLLKGGVIRTFGTIDEAAKSQYIPLFNNGEYTRDMQILLLGSAEEISKLIKGKTGLPQDYVDDFKKALGLAIENNTRLGHEVRPLKSWTDDISEIRQTDTVDQSLSGINIHAYLRGEETYNPINRHEEIVSELMESRRLEISQKIEKLSEADKPLKKTQERIAKLQENLLETSKSFAAAQRKAERNAWQDVTTEINVRVARANNEKDFSFRVTSTSGRLPNISPKSLELFFAKDQEMFRLYIPATVQEAMSRQFTNVVYGDGDIGKRIEAFRKNISDPVNNWWKSRITVLSLAFTTRNFIGNLFSNSMNIGVLGALDPKTNAQAFALSFLVDYHAKYGSIDNALAELSKPDKIKRDRLVQTKGVDTKAQRLREVAEIKTTVAASLRYLGASKGSDIIDIGDGLLRPLDDILTDLQNRNVLSGSGTYRIDVDEIAYDMQHMAASMGVKEATGKTIKAPVGRGNISSYANALEDAVYVGLPFIMGAPFVGVPKFLGSTIARRTENQARALNYLGNIKQGKTPDEAADMVAKFLFDYGDLTVAQKKWLRPLIPFFTWNQKNILLHLELMQKNPTYYAQFYRFFYVTMPEIVAARDRDLGTQEELNLPTIDVREEARERIKTGPGYRAFRIGVEIDRRNNIVIQGFGLPLEGFAQNVGTANDIIDATIESIAGMFPGGKSADFSRPFKALSPYVSQTHVGIRSIIELLADYDVFREQSMTEGGSYDYKKQYILANDFGNLVQQLSSYSNPSIPAQNIGRVPAAGAGHMMAQYIINALDMVPVRDDGGKIQWEIHNPRLIKSLMVYRKTPYERLLREAATAVDLNETMYMTPELVEAGQSKPFLNNELARNARYLFAYSGIKFKQDAPMYAQQKRYREEVIRTIIDYHKSMIPE